MPAHRKLPDHQKIMALIDAGFTHAEIAAMYNVARTTVSAHLTRAGETDRRRYDTVVPWSVKIDHNHHYALQMLRILGRKVNGDYVTEEQDTRLDNWLARMIAKDLVVNYDRDSQEGFTYEKRQRSDIFFVRAS